MDQWSLQEPTEFNKYTSIIGKYIFLIDRLIVLVYIKRNQEANARRQTGSGHGAYCIRERVRVRVLYTDLGPIARVYGAQSTLFTADGAWRCSCCRRSINKPQVFL